MKIVFLEPSREVSPYCWLIEIGSATLGVHQRGGWCMQLDEQMVYFDSEDKCVPLGPILEVEAEKLIEFLQKAAQTHPVYSESIERFPKELLLKHVFHTSFSGYWPERALEWLCAEQRLQPLFKDELEKFIQNKMMPQGARQKAQKILRRLSA